MIKKIYLHILLLIFANQLFSFNQSVHFAHTFVPYTHMNKPEMSTFDITYTYGTTSEGKNEKGQTVPYLQQWGAEPLPTYSIDETADLDDSFGQGLFSGKYSEHVYTFRWTKNIASPFFLKVQAEYAFQYLTDISAEFLPHTNPTALQTEQLQSFKNILLLKQNRTYQDGIKSIELAFGYAQHWQNFTKIDFIDITTSAGIYLCGLQDFSPFEKTGFSQLYIKTPYDYGVTYFPIQCSIAVGYLHWLTLGCSATYAFAAPHITKKPALSNSQILYHNELSKRRRNRAQAFGQHMYTYTTYAQADHLFAGCSLTGGYTYKHKDESYISSHRSKNITIPAWSTHTLFLHLETDFATEEKPYLPQISVYLSKVLGGKYAPLTITAGMQAGIHLGCTF